MCTCVCACMHAFLLMVCVLFANVFSMLLLFLAPEKEDSTTGKEGEEEEVLEILNY